MSSSISPEIRVCLDVGCYEHHASVGLSDGQFLESFTIRHEKRGFNQFFSPLKKHEEQYPLPISIVMEDFNGHARPLDQLINKSDYRLFNVNNLKLRRYKEIFPSPGKSDAIDSRKGLELFQLKDHLPLAGDVLQEVAAVPSNHQQLKRLTRVAISWWEKKCDIWAAYNRICKRSARVCSVLRGHWITGGFCGF